ncbi:MAG TPA: SRPBCC family protein, partial [Solirubrobacteraceae bacterium]
MAKSTEDQESVRESKATEAAEEKLESAGDDTDNAEEAANGAIEVAKDTLKSGGKEISAGLLKSVVAAARQAAQEVLEREARAGAKQAAEYLSQKAPELAKEQIEKHGGGGPAAKAAANFGKAKLEGAGGAKAVTKAAGGALKGVGETVKDKVGDILPGGGGDGDDGQKQTRRLPVMYAVDIGVPLEVAYNEWTQFEDSPAYMHRLRSVNQDDDTHLEVNAKIWGFKRHWNAEIVEQTPNERIEWRTTGGTSHHGVVTFHALDENLTRVMLTLDFPPEGLLEKMGSGLRIVRRAAIGDLKRFKAQLEMRDEERGAWRGRIEEGEVVSEEGDEDEAEARGDEEEYDEPEAEEELDEEEEPEAEADEEEEPEAEADEDEEPEAEADEEEE